MKRLLLISLSLILILFCFASCNKKTDKPDVVVDYSTQTEMYILDDNGDLSIMLDSNPSTGFLWSYSISDTDSIECKTDEFISSTDDDTIVGAGGKQHYVFTSLSCDFKENIMISLVYSNGEIDTSNYNFIVTIGEDGNVLVTNFVDMTDTSSNDSTEDERISIDGKNLIVTLDANPSTGYQWKYEIENINTDKDSENIILNSEDIVSNDDENDGASAKYVASFTATKSEIENRMVEIYFSYISPDGETIEETLAVDIVIDTDGSLTLANT